MGPSCTKHVLRCTLAPTPHQAREPVWVLTVGGSSGRGGVRRARWAAESGRAGRLDACSYRTSRSWRGVCQGRAVCAHTQPLTRISTRVDSEWARLEAARYSLLVQTGWTGCVLRQRGTGPRLRPGAQVHSLAWRERAPYPTFSSSPGGSSAGKQEARPGSVTAVWHLPPRTEGDGVPREPAVPGCLWVWGAQPGRGRESAQQKETHQSQSQGTPGPAVSYPPMTVPHTSPSPSNLHGTIRLSGTQGL